MSNLDPDRREADDPRPKPRDDWPSVDSGGELRSSVAGVGNDNRLWLVSGGAVLAGLLVFVWLALHRPHPPNEADALPSSATSAAPLPSAPATPPDVAAMAAAGNTPKPAPAPVQVVAAPMPMVGPALAPAPAAPPPPHTPVLVVDYAAEQADGTPTAAAGAPAKSGAAAGAAPGPSQPGGLNGDEQFAARVEGSEPDRARATVLRGRSAVVAQGAIIPGVLETALDSDLPGFARAVVSRDVRSFDGSAVLIPRGSRLIGEYRSAVALGQSRAFVIWTRVLRPDGISIQIGSPATDALGRAGLSGSVDHHFLQTFGGAILLSVVNAGVTALSGTPSTEVVIGSSQAATGLASTVSAYAPQVIPPTIKVPQGTPIRIFVARDLDFGPVEGRGQ